MTEFFEGELKFQFDEGYKVIKFDDSKFYREKYNKLPGSKGVDFIAYKDDDFIMIEVKDCLHHETENKSRTSTGKENEETFDIEVSKKVASTFSCIVGANTYYKGTSENAEEIASLFSAIKATKINKTIRVCLVLEGNFEKTVTTRKPRMIRNRIKEKMSTYLNWIHCCKVVVCDISEINSSSVPFSVTRCTP